MLPARPTPEYRYEYSHQMAGLQLLSSALHGESLRVVSIFSRYSVERQQRTWRTHRTSPLLIAALGRFTYS
jgi:hypothetical protein